MKFFALGLGIGSALGAAFSLLPNAENTHRVKDDVKNWINETTDEVKVLASSLNKARSAEQKLSGTLPQAQKTISSLQKNVNGFTSSIQPNIKVVMKSLNNLNDSSDKLKKI